MPLILPACFVLATRRSGPFDDRDDGRECRDVPALGSGPRAGLRVWAYSARTPGPSRSLPAGARSVAAPSRHVHRDAPYAPDRRATGMGAQCGTMAVPTKQQQELRGSFLGTAELSKHRLTV